VSETIDRGRAGREALSIANVVGSALAALALVLVFVVFHSELALAQAADSISDVLTGLLLAWAARAALAPPDDEHPFGHARAEPITALIVAVLGGVLATEVVRSAALAWMAGAHATLGWPVAAVFAGKVVFKLAVAAVATRSLRHRPSPVLDALRVDARNDAVVGSAALVGVGLARMGYPELDPILAIGVGVYVGISCIRLARDGVMMLLGTSAPALRRAELLACAMAVPRVSGVGKLVAIFYGTTLHVELDVWVDARLSLREAHDVAHAVESRMMQEPDVSHVVVHVTPHEAAT
jgi:cation diffusion facilitator family transporter